MKRTFFFSALITSVGLWELEVSAQTPPPSSAPPTAEAVAPAALAVLQMNHERQGFPDFGFMVSSSDYVNKYSDQPVFRLKADFPKQQPTEMPKFLEIDFKKEPLKYIEAVRDYAFEGNLPGWDAFKNTIRAWYHIPWLHPTTTGPSAYPPNGGTEGFHGLIKEAPIGPKQLGPNLNGVPGDYSVYAITLVNDMAGYAMGRMWKEPQNPEPRAVGKRFPNRGVSGGTGFRQTTVHVASSEPDQGQFPGNPLQRQALTAGKR